jgi:sulfur transfer complex TusBCD TusB component (DsrH family)
MKVLSLLSICSLLFLLAGCTGETSSATEPIAISQSTPALGKPSSGASIFLDTDAAIPALAEPHVVRWRAVKINLALLLDESGQARDVKEFTINLFPDVVYTGVIELVEQAGDVVSWSGTLKGVENSYFTMVYTSGAFMGHFGSPLGVYEAAYARDEVYRIIEIDQNKFPGGEG